MGVLDVLVYMNKDAMLQASVVMTVGAAAAVFAPISVMWRLLVAVATLVATRRVAAGGSAPPKVNMSGKTVIVTGANTGCGLQTSLQLAQMGAHVVMACRNPQLGNAAVATVRSQLQGSGSVEFAQLDLSDLVSVKKFATEFLSRSTKLDVLVNNAGIMLAPYGVTAQGIEMHFGVNHVGHFLLTTLLLPLLSRSGGRVVNLSSMAMCFAKNDRVDMNQLRKEVYDKPSVYGISKLANALFTYELARRCDKQGNGVRVVSVHPGAVATDLMRHLPAIVNSAMNMPKKLMMKTPAEGAWTSVYCATNSDIKQGGFYLDSTLTTPPPFARDAKEAEKLWTLSEQLAKNFV